MTKRLCGDVPSPVFPMTPRTLALALRAAEFKSLPAGGAGELIARLETMAEGLLPEEDRNRLFAAVFAAGGSVAGPPASVWEIGESFWRDSYAVGERRRLEGSHYTPVVVIDAILDLIWDALFPGGLPRSGRGPTVCDPAMGCGFFHLRIIERLLARHPDKADRVCEWAAANLFGVDIDAGAVFMARILMWIILSRPGREFVPSSDRFVQGDSLLGPSFFPSATGEAPLSADGLDWRAVFPEPCSAGGFGAVIGNPPYEVLTNFARRPERRALAEALRHSGFYNESLSGQINLYRCFVERSLELLKPGGVLSMVVPLSFSRDAFAAPLRRRLLETTAADRWLLFAEKERVFPGVTQAACVFRATKEAGPAETLRVSSAGGDSFFRMSQMRKHAGEALFIPELGERGAALLEWLWDNCAGRIADVADIRVGEVDQTVFRDCMSDSDTGCILARGAHLTPFLLDVSPEPGRERFLDLPLFLRKKGKAAEACRERASAWRVCQLGIRNMNSLPRLVAALAPPGVYLGNSLNAYHPGNGVSPEYVAGVLNSRILDWLFRIGSGNNNVNLAEMRRLPFPVAPEPALMQAVAKGFRDCAAAATSGGDLAIARSVLDKAVEACYGVPHELAVVLDGYSRNNRAGAV